MRLVDRERQGRGMPGEGKVVAGNSTRAPGQFSGELAIEIHLFAHFGTRVGVGNGRKRQVAGSL